MFSAVSRAVKTKIYKKGVQPIVITGSEADMMGVELAEEELYTYCAPVNIVRYYNRFLLSVYTFSYYRVYALLVFIAFVVLVKCKEKVEFLL